MNAITNMHQAINRVSVDMAEVRARVDFKVGANSNIDAEILSFRGLKTDKEHVAIIFKQDRPNTRHAFSTHAL